MSTKRRKLNLDNNMSNKRRKLNPDNDTITISNKRRKLNPDSIIEIKKRQENYYDDSKKYDNYIEINHCKEAIQMAVDIALKKKEAQTGGKKQKKRTNKNNKTNKKRTNKRVITLNN